jgi:hypothetical protein
MYNVLVLLPICELKIINKKSGIGHQYYIIIYEIQKYKYLNEIADSLQHSAWAIRLPPTENAA